MQAATRCGRFPPSGHFLSITQTRLQTELLSNTPFHTRSRLTRELLDTVTADGCGPQSSHGGATPPLNALSWGILTVAVNERRSVFHWLLSGPMPSTCQLQNSSEL